MGSKALSDTHLRNLKPRAKPFKVSDGGGLHILVTPAGGKLWRQAYRFDGKQQTLALGAYPAVSLLDARRERDQAKKDLAGGKDPAIAKQERKRLAARGSASNFAKVAEEWFDNRKGPWGEGHRKRVWGSIENDVIPIIGHLAVNRVEPEDVLRALRRFEDRGSIEMARRTRSYVEDIFRFAKAERLTTVNPALDLLDALKRPAKPKHFAKFKAHELPDFLRKLSAYHGKELTGLALRLTLLTMVRTTETRFARWHEFENWERGNIDKALWRLSPERMKMNREHLVPLSRQAIECLHQIKALSNGSELLFLAPTKSGVLSESAMLYVLYSMGCYGKATVHGLRGTASTILNENEFNSDWIEFQLAHNEEDEVRASYNSAEYLPQRRKMMQWWGDYLETAEGSVDPIG
jgi:integrase